MQLRQLAQSLTSVVSTRMWLTLTLPKVKLKCFPSLSLARNSDPISNNNRQNLAQIPLKFLHRLCGLLMQRACLSHSRCSCSQALKLCSFAYSNPKFSLLANRLDNCTPMRIGKLSCCPSCLISRYLSHCQHKIRSLYDSSISQR